MYPFPALAITLPLIPFTTEEVTGCTNEAVKDANKAGTKSAFVFVLCYTVSVTPSINTFKSSNNFMILKTSFISSFEINRVNPFLALAASFPFVFLSNVFIALEVILLTNPGQLYLAREITPFISSLLPELSNQELKDPPN